MFAQVVVKLTGPMDHLRLVWQVGETLLDAVGFDEDPEGNRYNVLLAVQEMVTNVLRHGYRCDDSLPIEVTFELHEDQLDITLRDQGPPFDPRSITTGSDVDTSRPPEAGGHGIRIARMVMDRFEYSREKGWNTLRMSKSVRVVAHT